MITESGETNKLTVHYCPENDGIKKVCDGEMESYIRYLVKSAAAGNYTILATSQEMAVNYVRLFVLLGLIPHNEVKFYFKDYVIYPDKYGNLDWWPEGFCDYNDNILTRLLEGKFNIHENKEKK